MGVTRLLFYLRLANSMFGSQAPDDSSSQFKVFGHNRGLGSGIGDVVYRKVICLLNRVDSSQYGRGLVTKLLVCLVSKIRPHIESNLG